MKNFELSEEVALKIGNIIKRRREELGYSTNFIEIRTGINKADLSRIENGKKKKINPIYLKELSKILKLNQIELFSTAGFIDRDYINTEELNIKQSNKKDYIIEQIKDPIKMITIPVFESVAAGIGVIPDAQPIDYISIPEMSGESVAIKVKGDSMEPTFYSGDLIVLKKEVEISIGEIGVFLNKSTGESVVKRLKNKNGTYILESDNHIFKDIEFKTDDIVCCGKVVNIIKKDLKKRVDPLHEMIDKLEPGQRNIIEMMINGLLEKK
ncbi:transcriptional regulator, XRE family protein [Cetobacterium sp. 2A]|uniref:XRE family transcriptional regulator n=1 Tax=Cetobacterium sp. 2A TaxID=2754723 RepID=UPI00163C9EC5|nr:XRE family transcriptional regulator [Cetobacterium sp. 2A]MBC2855453.1 transcriptional regulator, XRE family protein [Cetobacterium sp. 2A]